MPGEIPQPLLIAALLSITAVVVAVLACVAVIVWSAQRRRERESYYYSQELKRLTDAQGTDAALSFLRESDRIRTKQISTKARGGGLIMTAFSIGLLIFLWVTRSPYPYDAPAYAIAVVPLCVGLALLIHGFLVIRWE